MRNGHVPCDASDQPHQRTIGSGQDSDAADTAEHVWYLPARPIDLLAEAVASPVVEGGELGTLVGSTGRAALGGGGSRTAVAAGAATSVVGSGAAVSSDPVIDWISQAVSV